jgi:hypothetical protein
MQEVGRTREEWPAGPADGCSVFPLPSFNLVKLVQAPLCLYKRLLMMKFDTHTHNTF